MHATTIGLISCAQPHAIPAQIADADALFFSACSVLLYLLLLLIFPLSGRYQFCLFQLFGVLLLALRYDLFRRLFLGILFNRFWWCAVRIVG